MPVACAFLGAIFANIKTLQYANVETFIVFRSSTPLLVSVSLGRGLDWALAFGQPLGARALFVSCRCGIRVLFWPARLWPSPSPRPR